MQNIKTMAAGVRNFGGGAYNTIRHRFALSFVSFVLVLAVCCGAVFLTWFFDLFENQTIRIWLTVLVLMLPFTELLAEQKHLKSKGYLHWWLSVFVALWVMAFGVKYNLDGLVVGSFLAISALALLYLVLLSLRHQTMLLTGLLAGLVILMIYWIAAVEVNDEPLTLLLLPVPLYLLGGAGWALLARPILEWAQRAKQNRVSGPGLQALAMAMLFLPAISIATLVPSRFGLDPIWQVASLAIMGVLLSSVIADPLRQFLLEWGDLSPKPSDGSEEIQDG